MFGVAVDWPQPKVVHSTVTLQSVRSEQYQSLIIDVNANDAISFPDFSQQPISNIYVYSWTCQTGLGNDCGITLPAAPAFSLATKGLDSYTMNLTVTDTVTNTVYENIASFMIDPSRENAFRIKIIQPVCFNSNQRFVLLAETPDLTTEEKEGLVYSWSVLQDGIDITNHKNIIQSGKELLLAGHILPFEQSATYLITVTIVSPLSFWGFFSLCGCFFFNLCVFLLAWVFLFFFKQYKTFRVRKAIVVCEMGGLFLCFFFWVSKK